MTRNEFLDRLKKGLTGLPEATLKDIVADYETHFADAAAEGRTEADVSAALGDPERLARELRAEAGLKAWEDTKSPSSAFAALFAIIGLGALDILILLPLLMGIASALAGLFIGAIGIFIGGGVCFAIGPFVAFSGGVPGGAGAMLLGGLGLMALALTMASLTAIATIWLVNFVVWFARLHYRVAKPAIDGKLA
jgi:uncharacterized membrane protein